MVESHKVLPPQFLWLCHSSSAINYYCQSTASKKRQTSTFFQLSKYKVVVAKYFSSFQSQTNDCKRFSISTDTETTTKTLAAKVAIESARSFFCVHTVFSNHFVFFKIYCKTLRHISNRTNQAKKVESGNRPKLSAPNWAAAPYHPIN